MLDDDGFVFEDPEADTLAEIPTEEVKAIPDEEDEPVKVQKIEEPEEPSYAESRPKEDAEGFTYEDINTEREGYYVRPERPQPEADVSWSDTGNNFLGTVYDMIGGYGASLRRAGELAADEDATEGNLGEELGKYVQFWANGKSEAAREALSPQAQRIMQASVTDPGFWDRDNIWLQGAAQAPHILSAVIAAAVLKTPRAAYAMEAANADAMMTNDLYRKLDNLTDEQLKSVVIDGKSPYAENRANGMNERQARREFAKHAIGLRPELLSGITAAVGAIDPSGMLARKLVGGKVVKEGVEEAIDQVAAPKKLIRRVPEAGLLGGASEAVQGGAEAVLTQSSEIASGQREEYDVPAVLEQAATEGTVGGFMGSAIGLIPDRQETRKLTPYEAPPMTADPIIKPEDITLPDQPMKQPKSTTVGNKAGAQKAIPGVVAPTNPLTEQDTKVTKPTVVATADPVVNVNPGMDPANVVAIEGKPVNPNVRQRINTGRKKLATGLPVEGSQTVPGVIDTPPVVDAVDPTLQGNQPTVVDEQVVPATDLQPVPETATEAQGEALEVPATPTTPEVLETPPAPDLAEPAPVAPVKVPKPKKLTKKQIAAQEIENAKRVAEEQRLSRVAEYERVKGMSPTEQVAYRRAKALEEVQAKRAAALQETPAIAEEAPVVEADERLEVETAEQIAAREKEYARLAAEQAAINIGQAARTSEEADRLMIEKDVDEERLKKKGKKKIAERAHTLDTADKVTRAHLPVPAENDVFITDKAAKSAGKVNVARRLVAGRVAKMMTAFNNAKDEDGESAKLPQSFKDTANPDEQYSIQTLLMMEAKALHNKIRSGKVKAEDYHRFKRQEYFAILGDLKAMLEARRTEAAKQVSTDAKPGAAESVAPEDYKDPLMKRAEETVLADDLDEDASDDAVPDAPVTLTPKEKQEAREKKLREQEEAKREAARKEGYAPVTAPQPVANLVVQKKRVINRPTAKVSDVVRRAAELNAKKSLKATKAGVGITSQSSGPLISGQEVEPPKKTMTAMDVYRALMAKKNKTTEAVKQAREETETDPTPAQVEAGNYKHGRVSVNGVPIALETPAGEIRTSKDPDVDWEVQMDYDYGYIVGTKADDGGGIDVLVGTEHDSPTVWVVDQVDPNTRDFDEHKALMSFEDEQDALRGYASMFSDNSASARVGEFTPMTLDEFKAWTKLPVKQRREQAQAMRAAHEADRAKEYRDTLYQLQSDLSSGYETLMSDTEVQEHYRRTGKAPDGYRYAPHSGRSGKISYKTNVRKFLGSMKLNHLTGTNAIFAKIMNAHLMKLVGDVEVVVMTPREMQRLGGYNDIRKVPWGWHEYTPGQPSRIVLSTNALADPYRAIHTPLHEAVHAAAVDAVEKDPIFAMEIGMIIDHIKSRVDLSRTDFYTKYGLKDAHEFIAEALTNDKFQELLGNMTAPPQLAARYKMDAKLGFSMWDVLLAAVRKAFGMPKGTHSMLEIAMRVTKQGFEPVESRANNRFNLSSIVDEGVHPNVVRISEMASQPAQAQSAVDKYFNGPAGAPSMSKPWLLRFRGFDSIARAAERLMGTETPVTLLNDLIEGQRRIAEKLRDKAAPVIQRLADLQKKYRGEQWEEFASFLNDEQMAGVFADRSLADNTHISSKGESDIWQREQHPELVRRYNALPADLKAARTEALAYFTAQQNNMALKNIRNNVVALTDTADPEAMAQRIFEGKETDKDIALIGEDLYNDIKASGAYSRVDGPYLPLMRRGKFVVKGRLKITSPSNGTRIRDNEYEFKTRKEAGAWAAKQEGRPTLRSFFVDKTTGETHKDVDGQQVRLTEKDPNTVQRTRVNVQHEFMEMVDTLAEAREMVAGLRSKGIDTDDAVPRKFENGGIQQDLLSTSLRNMNDKLVRRAEARGHTQTQIREMVSSLNEMAVNAMGATRIQSHRLPRRHVKGASTNVVQNLIDYSHSSSNYLAKLDTQPRVDKALKELDALVAENAQSGKAAALTSIANETKRRITTPSPTSEGNFSPVVNRFMTLSFIDKLMSPAYSMMDALQPMMTSLPYLASHYGAGRAAVEMSRAYRDIGTVKQVLAGIGGTARKLDWNNTDMPTHPADIIKGRLSDPGEQAFITAMQDIGVIGADAGFEIEAMTQSARGVLGLADKSLRYVETIARQMPKTIEAINRTTVGLAAYRLEMKRSGDVAKATKFAKDTINLTQFNYSSTNTAPYMNHPMLRLILQFKKYGASMYQMLGEQMGVAFSRNATPEQRIQAAKAVAYTIGMHVVMAGAMGLPTEPLRLAVLAAHQAGLTDLTWADVDDAVRNYAADTFGKEMGEMVTRGAPHGLGIDLSSRLGLDTLMGPFGEPRSDEAQDFKAYLWDAVGGAPAGLAIDWVKGVNDIANQDFVRGAERLVPVKVISDAIKAYRVATEGTVSEKTGKQTMSPYDMGEAVAQTLGFTPSRVSESFERSSAFYRRKTATEDQTTEFKRSWLDASGAGRGRVWRDIRTWNRGRPREEQITLQDLHKYQKRIKKELKETREGIRAGKRDQAAMRRVEETYNYLP